MWESHCEVEDGLPLWHRQVHALPKLGARGRAQRAQTRPGGRLSDDGVVHQLKRSANPGHLGAVVRFRNYGLTLCVDADCAVLTEPLADAELFGHPTWGLYFRGVADGQAQEGASISELIDNRAERIRPVRQVSLDDVWSALRFRPA